ncbi:hypothetical protein [Actinophytocola algeriensis]|uniref:Uncharacterized protein n=1 Tax=Actinophytocola algeriensis TaxID=1768010 RepID=A0A7W7VHF8_9PSEU|nr:hypothetical protein [Actinophytocola algeriensis]MBB4910363.1 hypothetical protein [Actinophytocola algeriensis]MBE1480648.1 hypothetical protein [Actinophytocola algeriensis]
MVPVGSLILLVVVVIAPTLLFWVMLRVPKTLDAIGAYVRKRRLGPAPAHPPIERLAADLRRVHRTLAEFPPGTPAVRRRATREAYDALLVQACAAVDVPHRLDSVGEGMDREVERLRIEEALRAAGISVS